MRLLAILLLTIPLSAQTGENVLLAVSYTHLDVYKRQGHFREEYQTPEGEAARDDEHYSYAAAWEYGGPGQPPVLHKEPLSFEYVHPSQRSYK